MRLALLYNPRLLVERLAEVSLDRRRLKRLRGTVAEGLNIGHIDSLELLELLRERPPRVIYDIGANVGTWTQLAKALFPDAEIHAFEPLGQLKREFLRRTEGIRGVFLHTVALGAQSTQMPMKLADFIDASSLLEMTASQRSYFNVHRAGEEIVRVECLDEYVARQCLPQPNLIKLDIQGYEIEALRGGERCLRYATAVLSEVSFIEFYHGQCMFHDVVGFLAARAFHFRSMSGRPLRGGRLLQADVLFQRLDI